MFGIKKRKKLEYDSATQQPAVKSSICTGERVAGFIDLTTKQFHDYMLIRNDLELLEFCEMCGVEESELKKIV